MKKTALLVAVLIIISTAMTGASKSDCSTIKDGIITDTAGNVLVPGFDLFGYNYQAHQFEGTYDSSDRTIDGTYWGQTGDFVDDKLSMKWSDDWLSNQDCNGDNKLDRGTTGTSLGWITNHVVGDYDSNGDGTQDAHFTGFDKIVWVGPGGSLWGEYEIIQTIFNDPTGGLDGLTFKSPSPGFGQNNHWTEN